MSFRALAKRRARRSPPTPACGIFLSLARSPSARWCKKPRLATLPFAFVVPPGTPVRTVACMTCHHGLARPEELVDVLDAAFRKDATLRSAVLVALSGYAQAEDLEHATSAGLDHHLVKPPTLESIRHVLSKEPVEPAG